MNTRSVQASGSLDASRLFAAADAVMGNTGSAYPALLGEEGSVEGRKAAMPSVYRHGSPSATTRQSSKIHALPASHPSPLTRRSAPISLATSVHHVVARCRKRAPEVCQRRRSSGQRGPAVNRLQVPDARPAHPRKPAHASRLYRCRGIRPVPGVQAEALLHRLHTQPLREEPRDLGDVVREQISGL